jgi:hypothetical protein
MAVAHAADTSAHEAQAAMVKQYCATCHSEKGKAGGLSLVNFDPSHAADQADVSEKIIRKLRAGMMPPPLARRPAADVLNDFTVSLESRIDAAAALHPNPGRRTFLRLNRAEYARSIDELLDLEVDVNAFLPPDTMSAGFDNIADVQSLSPTLLEGYLRAASKISTLALGDRGASPSEVTYKVPRTQSQNHHIDGTPWGTRGGISMTHTFPADGEYTFRAMLHGTPVGDLFGSVFSRSEQLEISLDGERTALIDIDFRISEKDKAGLNIISPRVRVTAGPHRLAAAFIQKFDGVFDDLIAPIDYTLADTEYGDSVGITALPHVRDLAITGPYAVTGVSDTPSRRRVFVCRPLTAAEELPCARKIVGQLASQAYRHPASGEDVESLMGFYSEGRKGKDFEAGHPHDVAGAPGQPALPVPPGRDSGRRAPRSELSNYRPRSGHASLVFRLGHGPGRRAAESGDGEHAPHHAGAREAGPPPAGGSARRGDLVAVRVAVAAAAGRREDPPRRAAVPLVRQRARHLLQA